MPAPFGAAVMEGLLLVPAEPVVGSLLVSPEAAKAGVASAPASTSAELSLQKAFMGVSSFCPAKKQTRADPRPFQHGRSLSFATTGIHLSAEGKG
jgi:hypothetical protein